MGQNGLHFVSLCLFVSQTLKNAAPFRARKQQWSSGGFTIVELIISMAIVATLTAIAVPLAQDYIYRANVARAVTEIRGLEKEIIFFKTERGRYPGWYPNKLDTLQEIGRDNFLDPWGTPYQYLNLEQSNPDNEGKPKNCRKDRSRNPLNADFDLYSVGPDRVVPTHRQITKESGADDIVRAASGQYVGEGSKY
jgi:general secretion pathway protein G